MSSIEEENEYLKPENFYEGYNKSIEKLKNNPEAIEIDKLCYLVFRSEEGKRLIEIFKDRYIYPAYVHPNSSNMSEACIYFEGFKEGFRQIIASIHKQQQRIDAESIKV